MPPFVYLLDHQYTQRGLAWERLKNADASRAAALQEAARQFDCEVFLALAEVRETREPEEMRGMRGGYADYDDYDDEKSPPPTPAWGT